MYCICMNSHCMSERRVIFSLGRLSFSRDVLVLVVADTTWIVVCCFLEACSILFRRINSTTSSYREVSNRLQELRWDISRGWFLLVGGFKLSRSWAERSTRSGLSIGQLTQLLSWCFRMSATLIVCLRRLLKSLLSWILKFSALMI